jgi:DNA gyrase subunit A
VTVIKLGEGDRVVGFLCTSDRDEALTLETDKGKKIKFSVGRHELVARGGKGRQLSRRERIKQVSRPLVWVQLPEEGARPRNGNGNGKGGLFDR